MHETLSSRLIGFVASLILTLIAFFLVARPHFFHLRVDIAILIILVLAAFQGIAQSIFFLNILGEKGPRWNLIIFISTISFIVIIVLGSIWIMNHLNRNMMP